MFRLGRHHRGGCHAQTNHFDHNRNRTHTHMQPDEQHHRWSIDHETYSFSVYFAMISFEMSLIKSYRGRVTRRNIMKYLLKWISPLRLECYQHVLKKKICWLFLPLWAFDLDSTQLTSAFRICLCWLVSTNVGTRAETTTTVIAIHATGSICSASAKVTLRSLICC